MIKNMANYYTTYEAAARMDFHPDYIRRLICKGILKAEKIGNIWFIKQTDLAKIKRQRRPRKKEQPENGSNQR